MQTASLKGAHGAPVWLAEAGLEKQWLDNVQLPFVDVLIKGLEEKVHSPQHLVPGPKGQEGSPVHLDPRSQALTLESPGAPFTPLQMGHLEFSWRGEGHPSTMPFSTALNPLVVK